MRKALKVLELNAGKLARSVPRGEGHGNVAFLPDNWEHTLELEKITPKTKREKTPYCMDGKRACPPEDCGGPWGYKHYLSALKSKKGSKYRDAVEVMGRHYDPKKFDKSTVNKESLQLLRDE